MVSIIDNSRSRRIKTEHPMSTRKRCSLTQALGYSNDRIVWRFAELYDLPFAEAEDIFTETKKWLWLNAQPGIPSLFVSDAMMIIDEMWHTFILFTSEYTSYCEEYYGGYIHHAPVTRADKERMMGRYIDNPQRYIAEQTDKLRAQCMSIYLHLGEATLLKWYVDYPERYGDKFFRHKPALQLPSWEPTELLHDLAEPVDQTGYAA